MRYKSIQIKKNTHRLVQPVFLRVVCVMWVVGSGERVLSQNGKNHQLSLGAPSDLEHTL
jgi:hypothetical protein